MAQKFTLQFLRKEEGVKDIWSFLFSKKRNTPEFLSGQYIHMVFPEVTGDKQGNSRMFTIASSPTEENIMITTKIGNSNFKKTLAKIVPGTHVEFYGPSGGFVLSENDFSSRLFISGGIGITPFRSMLTYASYYNMPTVFTLLASFSTTKEILYYNELLKLANAHANIKLHFCITDQIPFPNILHAAYGRISKELIMQHIAEIKNPIVMISGSPLFVENISEMVLDAGIPENNIKVDEFTGY